MGDGGRVHLRRHTEVEQQGVAPLGHPLDRRHPVHVPLDEMPAQPIRRAQRSLEIHAAARRVFIEQRAASGRLHHVDREAALDYPLHREAGAVDRDALALAHAAERSAHGEGQARPGLPVAGDRQGVL